MLLACPCRHWAGFVLTDADANVHVSPTGNIHKWRFGYVVTGKREIQIVIENLPPSVSCDPNCDTAHRTVSGKWHLAFCCSRRVSTTENELCTHISHVNFPRQISFPSNGSATYWLRTYRSHAVLFKYFRSRKMWHCFSFMNCWYVSPSLFLDNVDCREHVLRKCRNLMSTARTLNFSGGKKQSAPRGSGQTWVYWQVQATKCVLGMCPLLQVINI